MDLLMSVIEWFAAWHIVNTTVALAVYLILHPYLSDMVGRQAREVAVFLFCLAFVTSSLVAIHEVPEAGTLTNMVGSQGNAESEGSGALDAFDNVTDGDDCSTAGDCQFADFEIDGSIGGRVTPSIVDVDRAYTGGAYSTNPGIN